MIGGENSKKLNWLRHIGSSYVCICHKDEGNVMP